MRCGAFCFAEGFGEDTVGATAGRGGGVEVEERADVCFVGAGDGIAFVDEGEEEGFFVGGGGGFGEGEEGDWGGAEG